jgi:hypothetical protein
MRAAIHALGVPVAVFVIAATLSAAAQASSRPLIGQTHVSAIVDTYYYHGRYYPYYHNQRYYRHRYWNGGHWRYY